MMKTIFFWDFCVAKMGKKPPLGPFYAANLFFTLRFGFILYLVISEFVLIYWHLEMSKMATNIAALVLSLSINSLAEKAFKKHEPQMERDYKKLPVSKRRLYRAFSIVSLILLLTVIPYTLYLLHK